MIDEDRESDGDKKEYADGCEYKGELNGEKRHGVGIFTWPNTT